MNAVKQRLLYNWHLMRIVRLALGLLIGIGALMQADAMMGLFAAFFLFQAVTDTGCCGTAACAAPPQKVHSSQSTDIEYEEIKQTGQR